MMTPTLTVIDAKLLPCPFCGKAPERNSTYAWCHGHDEDEIAQHLTVQQPHAAWNTRTPSDDVERSIKRLIERADTLAFVNRYYVTGQGCFELEADLRLAIAALAAQPPQPQSSEVKS